MNTIYESLNAILKEATITNLEEKEILQCLELLEHFEYGLCFDSIVTQLYEKDIKIEKDFFDRIEKVATKLQIGLDKYVYLKKLIK